MAGLAVADVAEMGSFDPVHLSCCDHPEREICPRGGHGDEQIYFPGVHADGDIVTNRDQR
jgi:hypothetical protein